jgi:two-component system sensor histidine kinase DegS
LIGAIELVREITKLKKTIDIQKRFLQRVTQIREEETTRLAGNLHDEIGSLTVVVNCGLRILEEKLKTENCPGSLRSLVKFRASLEEMIGSFKDLSRDFMPIDVEKLGLIPGLKKYFARVREYAKLRVDFSSSIKNIQMLDIFKNVLYRLIEEAVNNTIKHANADRITVRFDMHNDTVVLTVKDNGKGFNVHSAIDNGQSGGMGMHIMKNRVESLGGELNIRSSSGTGTQIRAKLPLKREPEPWL